MTGGLCILPAKEVHSHSLTMEKLQVVTQTKRLHTNIKRSLDSFQFLLHHETYDEKAEKRLCSNLFTMAESTDRTERYREAGYP